MPENTESVKYNKKNSIFLANELLSELRETNNYLIYDINEKEFYVFTGKIYEMIDERRLDEYIYKFLIRHEISDLWKIGRLSEIKRAILMSDHCEKVEMNSHASKICFNNGVFDIDLMQLLPHNRNFYFSEFVNVNFNASAKSPIKFIEFLNTLFVDSAGVVDQTALTAIKQIGGYLLYPRNQMEKMFVFVGGGANGKSLLLAAYSMFFDKKNVSYLSLEELSKNTFIRSKLIGSRINITTESKGGNIDSEEIKKIVSGEGITVDQKYKEHINYIPRTKLIVATNSRPYFNDTSNGIERRLFFLEFKNRFLPAKEFAAAQKNERYKYARLMLAKPKQEILDSFMEERDGILLFFMSGLKELKENNWQIIEGENSVRMKENFKMGNDMVSYWLKENYELCGEKDFNVFTTAEMLDAYRTWYCENVNTRSLNLSSISMAQKIREVFFVEPTRLSREGKRFFGFSLIQKGDVVLENELDNIKFKETDV